MAMKTEQSPLYISKVLLLTNSCHCPLGDRIQRTSSVKDGQGIAGVRFISFPVIPFQQTSKFRSSGMFDLISNMFLHYILSIVQRLLRVQDSRQFESKTKDSESRALEKLSTSTGGALEAGGVALHLQVFTDQGKHANDNFDERMLFAGIK